jgi:hypothetical protein
MSDFATCSRWPTYCGDGVPCHPDGIGAIKCFGVVETDGPYSKNHTIKTDYAITIAGFKVPIVNTERVWNTYEKINYGTPSGINGVYLKDEGIFWCLRPGTSTIRDYRASESCFITRSTLHYLDLRYGVCLYRKNIEKVVFNLNSGQTSLFKNPWGTREFGKVIIYSGQKKNWDSLCFEEWHLIQGGVDKVISTAQYDPLPEMRFFAGGGSDVLFDPTYPSKADPDLELILHTSPPTSSDEHAYDDQIRYHGYYSYKGAVNSTNWYTDGGVDYFYPAWCRALQEDPFWKYAAERRTQLWFPDTELINTTTYAPPVGITVDPLPRGTFVKHPQVGEVYQFLVEKRSGGYHLETSPNVNDIINNAVPEAERKSGTTLYYPIGVL